MKINHIGSNMTEIETETARVLFSYSTPVAAYLYITGENRPVGYVKTSKHWSVTTSKHINKWLNGANAQTVDQEFLANLV